jgi:ribonuclease HI
MTMWHIYFDGGSRGNPGPAGCGAVLRTSDYDDGPETERCAAYAYLGEQTNNVAEYKGLILGLLLAKKVGARSICLYGDSQLVIQQVRGNFRTSARLQDLRSTVSRLLCEFRSYELVKIRRDDNYRADALANKALDSKADQVSGNLFYYTHEESQFFRTLRESGIPGPNPSESGGFKRAADDYDSDQDEDSYASKRAPPPPPPARIVFKAVAHEYGVGCGATIYFPHTGYVEVKQYVHGMTHCQGQYKALLLALAVAKKYSLRDITIESDSEVVIKQLQGMWRVGTPSISRWHDDARAGLDQFNVNSINWVGLQATEDETELARLALHQQCVRTETRYR